MQVCSPPGSVDRQAFQQLWLCDTPGVDGRARKRHIVYDQPVQHVARKVDEQAPMLREAVLLVWLNR